MEGDRVSARAQPAPDWINLRRVMSDEFAAFIHPGDASDKIAYRLNPPLALPALFHIIHRYGKGDLPQANRPARQPA